MSPDGAADCDDLDILRGEVEEAHDEVYDAVRQAQQLAGAALILAAASLIFASVHAYLHA